MADLPQKTSPDYQALVERLTSPVVILNQAGKMCFMNPRAQQLLCDDLPARIEAHIKNRSEQRPLSQVRFKLENGAELVLRLRLSEIMWQDEPASLLSMQDVTAYITALLSSRREASQARQALEDLQTAHADLEEQAQALLSETADIRKQLDTEKAQTELARQENTQLQNELDQAKCAAQALQQARTKIDERLKNQIDALAETDKQRQLALEKNGQLQSQLAEAKRLADEVTQRRDQLERELDDHKQAMDKVKEELRQEIGKRESIQNENLRFRYELAKAKGESATPDVAAKQPAQMGKWFSVAMEKATSNSKVKPAEEESPSSHPNRDDAPS